MKIFLRHISTVSPYILLVPVISPHYLLFSTYVNEQVSHQYKDRQNYKCAFINLHIYTTNMDVECFSETSRIYTRLEG